MGDRRNILVDDGSGSNVALYAHWSGDGLEQTLARALSRGRGRWVDSEYLTRIIFCQMIADAAGDDVIETLMAETGFGISAYDASTDDYCEASPGYDLYVDVRTQQVSGFDDDGATWYSFDKFVSEFGD